MAAKALHASDCLARLRVLMEEKHSLNAYIVDNKDPHHSQYMSEVDIRSAVLTGQGFTTSSAHVVVTKDKAAVWTDCRYSASAATLDSEVWTVQLIGHPDTPSREEYLLKVLPPKSRVGVCLDHIPYRSWKHLEKELSAAGHSVVSIKPDLIDILRKENNISNTPVPGKNKMFIVGLEYAGKTWQDKVADIRQQLMNRYADAFVVTKLDELAWLFNIRGDDIPHNPFLYGYAIITMDSISLFVDSKKLTKEVQVHLGLNSSGHNNGMTVKVMPCSDINNAITNLDNKGKRIWMSTDVNAALGSLVKKSNLLVEVSPVARRKVYKNPVEVQAMKDCHIRDAVALCEYFAWLEHEVPTRKVTTVAAASKLEEYCREQEGFLDVCFGTESYISDEAGYLANSKSGTIINDKGLYLCASGRHYRDGTTNITRIFHFGTPTEWEKECYTRVLMGHIDCAATVFPRGTKGHALDAIARRALWEAGLDWMVFTGHGVGHVLCVMEDHYGISNVPFYQELPLDDGTCLTIEPAYYEYNGKGKKGFAIRLENLFVVRPTQPKRNHQGVGFLKFEAVSFAPFARNLIVTSMMTKSQINWLNAYHTQCIEMVAPVLREQGRTTALDWLLREAKPLQIDE